MSERPKISVLLLVSLVLLIIVAQNSVHAQTTSHANISGRVSYGGHYQDGVTVSLVGGSSDITKNGGYYNLSVKPNIAVTVKATFNGFTQTKIIEAGEAGTTNTANFDLAVSPTPSSVPERYGPNAASVVGLIIYNGIPLAGVPVNLSPITTATTDNTGHYKADVPAGVNMTISVVTPGGSDSKTIVTPSSGTVVVNLNVTSASTATDMPTPVQTNATTITPKNNATATQVSQPPTMPPTLVPLPATPTPASGAGSGSLALLAILGILCAVGILRLKK